MKFKTFKKLYDENRLTFKCGGYFTRLNVFFENEKTLTMDAQVKESNITDILHDERYSFELITRSSLSNFFFDTVMQRSCSAPPMTTTITRLTFPMKLALCRRVEGFEEFNNNFLYYAFDISSNAKGEHLVYDGHHIFTLHGSSHTTSLGIIPLNKPLSKKVMNMIKLKWHPQKFRRLYYYKESNDRNSCIFDYFDIINSIFPEFNDLGTELTDEN